jgi:hypothetical protein
MDLFLSCRRENSLFNYLQRNLSTRSPKVGEFFRTPLALPPFQVHLEALFDGIGHTYPGRRPKVGKSSADIGAVVRPAGHATRFQAMQPRRMAMAFDWSVSGGGTVDATGLFTVAGSSPVPCGVF